MDRGPDRTGPVATGLPVAVASKFQSTGCGL
jgi:hypothetical protein